jgi:hypothetical protein
MTASRQPEAGANGELFVEVHRDEHIEGTLGSLTAPRVDDAVRPGQNALGSGAHQAPYHGRSLTGA